MSNILWRKSSACVYLARFEIWKSCIVESWIEIKCWLYISFSVPKNHLKSRINLCKHNVARNSTSNAPAPSTNYLKWTNGEHELSSSGASAPIKFVNCHEYTWTTSRYSFSRVCWLVHREVPSDIDQKRAQGMQFTESAFSSWEKKVNCIWTQNDDSWMFDLLTIMYRVSQVYFWAVY